MFYGLFIVGSAGSGKSTFCKFIQEHAEDIDRNVYVVNLDPAAEVFNYKCDIDIRELITLEDAMEEMGLGPNGGLLFCIEYLLDNISWFDDKLQMICENDYILFDCPGQIELYTHLALFPTLIKHLAKHGFVLASMCMIDVTFLSDDTKYISGIAMAMSCAISLELPALTILTKCDLVGDKKYLKRYMMNAQKDFYISFEDAKEIDKAAEDNLKENEKNGSEMFEEKYKRLINILKELIDDYSVINIMPLDITNEKTVKDIIYQADYMIQYGDNLEPKEKEYLRAEELLNAPNELPAEKEFNMEGLQSAWYHVLQTRRRYEWNQWQMQQNFNQTEMFIFNYHLDQTQIPCLQIDQ